MRGIKTFGNTGKTENKGDGLYSLLGKWRRILKKYSHKRARLTRKKDIKNEVN